MRVKVHRVLFMSSRHGRRSRTAVLNPPICRASDRGTRADIGRLRSKKSKVESGVGSVSMFDL